MMKILTGDKVFLFPSKLGWMALRSGPAAVRQLTFGHSSAATASTALGKGIAPCTEPSRWQRDLIILLQRYAGGFPTDFSKVPVELDAASAFRRQVLSVCRKIAYGKTITYGQLAARVGSPGAARAVGTCMARNPLPLIIPCHRVTRVGGVIGRYSAAEGTRTKQQLLDMEAAHCALLSPA